MNKKKVSNGQLTRLERYLYEEIGVEFKACLYFFCILFFYAVYRLCMGVTVASILHMTEMIFLAYGMCYAQIYLFGGFDEADEITAKNVALMGLCSLIYTGISFVGKWFDKNIPVTIGFFGYMMLAYCCSLWVYKVRRNIDEKILNEDLAAFQRRN